MEFKFYEPSGFCDFILSLLKNIQRKAPRSFFLLTVSILLYFSGISQSGTSPFTFTQIASSAPDIIRPGGGAEQWNGQNTVNIPVQGTNTQRLDAYYRFNWYDIETGNRVYNWTVFDNQINDAINKGQKFSFSVMPVCPGCGGPSVGGASLQYPAFLHTLMQAEASPDWITSLSGMWVPNWNSNNYLTALENLNIDINNHLNTTSHNGVFYKDVINYIDIRGFGSFGEWHSAFIVNTMADYPSGTQPTVASYERIIDSYKNGFPTQQLVIMISTFDGDLLSNTMIPPEVGVYALQSRNTKGLYGWRRDNWGWTDSYLTSYLSGNNRGYGTLPHMSDSIMVRYKSAPVVGEPADLGNAGSGTSAFGSLPGQVSTYHACSFGNGNLDANASNSSAWNNFRTASMTAGYHLVLTAGNMTTTLNSGNLFSISLSWQNLGVAPTYDNWNVTYELRNASNVAIWSGISTFNPRLFSPSATASLVSDNFTLPSSVPQGTYSMYLIIRDPNSFRKPLPLNITGVNTDGSYLLRSNITVGAGSAITPPTANAGPDQTITLPVSTVSLTGTETDSAGRTINSYNWIKVSGPAAGTITSPSTANTTITGLVQGVYVYSFSVTDNLGATGTDNVQITVNPDPPVNQPPVANAGSNQTIQLPTSTASLTGSGTDVSGTITTYAWTKSSGPAGSVMSSPATANTNITGLVQGVYVYKLLLTDNLGDTGSATVQITVNPAVVNQPPVANAGPDQTITLPTNSVTISGSASSDPDGTIVSYLWTKISGPAQFNIVNNTSANTIVNNLTAGSYSFQLKVTDNGGAIAMDTIKIIVNSAPANQPPVANAGANISITLPTNVANLNGSASTDPDGTISAYAWTQVSGPSTATIAAATSANTAISSLVQGSYVFALKVTDNSGATNADSVTVTVNPAPNIPPVANAGTSKTITLPANSTNLDGSLSSDPDGSIVSYSWVQISGPSTSTILGGTLSIATATNMVAGVYTFQLTVTDNSGASANANVKITVNNSGAQPPIANAGADQTITLPSNSVTIDGSGSSASSGSIVSYVWSEKSGPSTVSLSNTAKNTLNNLQAGVYVFVLTVTDNNNATGTDSVVITVNPAANIPPVANPGPSISLTLPTNSATLNGTNSYDPDGTISTYSWTRVSGPNTPAASGANTATLSLSGLIAGRYTYQLTVTDNSGASSSALVNIIVAPAANVPPVANAGANQTITAPANSVILNGSSSYDPDGTITTYNWVTVSGPGTITINNSNTVTPSVVGLQPGVYTFQLTVTDNNGAATSDQVFVTVLPQVVLPNQAPVANAGSNLTITLPENTASLNGTSSFDPDGTISTYTWSQISGPSAAVITGANTSTPTISQLIVGQYVYQLTVTDNNGATNADQVTVTVNPAVAKVALPPVANAGPSDTITMPNNTYMLDASQSTDPDGTITSYQWQEIGGPNTVNSSTMNEAQVSISGLTEGQYEFQVTVTDNTGATSKATMNLTVEPGLTSTDKLVVFPNPANNQIHENITSSVTGTVKISVYDMNGRLVLSKQIDKSSETIIETMNVSSLASGMYTIQINIANQKTMVTKFIKN